MKEKLKKKTMNFRQILLKGAFKIKKREQINRDILFEKFDST